jgi:glycosyltransferase involved in cell wall biosynthesis
MNITGVVICYNEEKNIERCLKSLEGIVEEIIVVDSLSTDRTKTICNAFPNVKFIEQSWLGYAGQKNFANEKARFDFILSIDADEALSDELRKSILQLKRSDVAVPTAYKMNRLNQYCGTWIKHGGWYPDKKVRLFHKSVKWAGEYVHETLSFPSEAKIVFLKGDILHYTCSTVSEHVSQIEKFTTLAAQELFEKGEKASLFAIGLLPKWKFFTDYILKLGILDGRIGYQLCKISAFAVYLKYVKLREPYR